MDVHGGDSELSERRRLCLRLRTDAGNVDVLTALPALVGDSFDTANSPSELTWRSSKAFTHPLPPSTT